MIFQSFGIHLSILKPQATHQLVLKIAFTKYFFFKSRMAHLEAKYHYLLIFKKNKKNSFQKKFREQFKVG